MPNTKNEVFLSLPSGKTPDSTLAERLKQELEDRKFGVFYFKKNLAAGDNFPESIINKALQDSQVMVALLSESFLNSQPCMSELKMFQDSAKKIIIVPMDDRVAGFVEDNKELSWIRKQIQWAKNPFSDISTSYDSKIQSGALDIVTAVVIAFNTIDTVNSTTEARVSTYKPRFKMIVRREISAVEISVLTFHNFYPAYFVVCFDKIDHLVPPPSNAIQPETNGSVFTIAAEERFRDSLGEKAKGKEVYLMAAMWPLSQIFKIRLPIYYSSKQLILSDVFLHVPRDGSFDTHYVGALSR